MCICVLEMHDLKEGRAEKGDAPLLRVIRVCACACARPMVGSLSYKPSWLSGQNKNISQLSSDHRGQASL